MRLSVLAPRQLLDLGDRYLLHRCPSWLDCVGSDERNAQRGQRDVQPARSVAGLVDALVDGLVGDVRRQERLLVGGELTPGVRLEERRLVARRPLGGAEGALLGALVADPGHGHRGDPGRVVEGAQHPGDVAPRGVGQDPLGQRLGRFSLEVDDLPTLRRAQGLPEVEVAVHALDGPRPDRADGTEELTQCRAVLGQLRNDVQCGVEPLGHRLGQLRVVGRGSLTRREVLGQECVHLAHGLAQSLRLGGEVAADLVGVQVGLREQVAHRRQRELPAVAGGPQELLQHPQLQPVALDPSQQLRDVVRPGAGEPFVDLDVGVGAGSDPAEDLQQRLLAEGHRRVRLLAGEGRRGCRRVQLLARQPMELQRSVGRVGERAEVRRHRLAVVNGVVGVGPPHVGVLPPADERVVEPVLRVGVEHQRHLVEVAAAVVVGHLGQVDHDSGAFVGDDAEPAYAGHAQPTTLAAEPARPLDVLGELSPAVVGRARRQVGASLVCHGAVASSGGAVSRNQ